LKTHRRDAAKKPEGFKKNQGGRKMVFDMDAKGSSLRGVDWQKMGGVIRKEICINDPGR